MNFQQMLKESIASVEPSLPPENDLSKYAPVFERAVLTNYFNTNKIVEFCKPNIQSDILEKGISYLIDSSYSVLDETGFVGWQLRPDIRMQILDTVSPTKLRELLPSGWADTGDLIQRTIGDWITNPNRPMTWSNLSLAEITALLQVEKWLRKVVPAVPDKAALLAQQELLELLEPLRVLTKNFNGRQIELEELRKYVQWLPSANRVSQALEAITIIVQDIFDLHDKPPLMITGLGGIGKTTLVSKFILDHIDNPTKDKVPFIYLDFDHPGISFSEPLTLLVEGVRQLATQFPPARDSLKKLHRSMQDSLDQTRKSVRSAKHGSETAPQATFQSASTLEESRYLDEFSKAWISLGGNNYPLLVVFDSFEEVQRRLGAKLADIFQFLRAWSLRVPRLRVVLSGRWPISEFKTIDLPLGDFDENAAVAYLKYYGVSDKSIATAIFKKFKGNPLTLRLAAGVASHAATSPDEADFLTARYSLFRRIEEVQVQQELFRRNLNHIGDPLARQIAMPGLILRRVTPGAIIHILAKPCNLGELDEAKATEILEILRREPNICLPDADDTVRYRQDLRKKMLPLISLKDPAKVTAIHSSAIEYYSNKTGAEDRADAIYHRLARGDDYETVRHLITPDIQFYLENSMDELPPNTYVSLAEHFKQSVPPEILNLAGLNSFEKSSINNIQQALTSGKIETLELASKKSEERSERTFNSKLRRLEAILYERLGNLPKAEELAAKSIQEARAVPDPAAEIEILFLLARLRERNGLWPKAAANLYQALNLALQAQLLSEYGRALISYTRLLKRRGKQTRRAFNRLIKRARKIDNQFPANLDLGEMAVWLFPCDLLTSKDSLTSEMLWEVCCVDRILLAQDFQLICQKLSDRARSQDELEAQIHRILGTYLREISGYAGAVTIQIFDIAKILEKDGRIGILQSDLA